MGLIIYKFKFFNLNPPVDALESVDGATAHDGRIVCGEKIPGRGTSGAAAGSAGIEGG